MSKTITKIQNSEETESTQSPITQTIIAKKIYSEIKYFRIPTRLKMFKRYLFGSNV